MSLPTTMRALVLPRHALDLHEAIAGLRVEERPLPVPARGQVLIRMTAAPCNPSDLLFLQDQYGVKKTLPTVPGWEGAGEIVASGGGILPWFLKGKRVACAGQADRDGTWAEYFVTDAMHCLPLIKGMDAVQGSMLIVNPFTAAALLDEARSLGSKAVVHLAAASALGRMMVPLARDMGLPLINVVRRPAQVELLRGLGAEHVLNSSDDDHLEQLSALCQQLGATVACDPVAGARTGQVLDALGQGGTVLVYGALSGQPCAGIDPIGLIFRAWTVRGFWLSEWVEKNNMLRIINRGNALQKQFVAGNLRTAVRTEVGFDDFARELDRYVDDMTGGKVVLRPGQ